jgi:hypothetical protein
MVLEPLTVTMVVTMALVLLEAGGAVIDGEFFFVVEGGSDDDDDSSGDEVSDVAVGGNEEVGGAEEEGFVVWGGVEDDSADDERDGELEGVVEVSGVVFDDDSDDELPVELLDDGEDGDTPVPGSVFWRLLWIAASTFVAETSERSATTSRSRTDILGDEGILNLITSAVLSMIWLWCSSRANGRGRRPEGDACPVFREGAKWKGGSGRVRTTDWKKSQNERH